MNLFFSRNNSEIGQQLIIDDVDSVKKSFWNPDHPTRFVTHRWHGNCDGGCTQIRDGIESLLILIAFGFFLFWILNLIFDNIE